MLKRWQAKQFTPEHGILRPRKRNTSESEFSMGVMDQGLKRLIQLRPLDWLIFARSGAQIEYLGTRQTDVATEPPRILDTHMEARYNGQPCLVNIEAEAYPSAEIGRRFYEYAARASVLFKLDVISIVFWLQRDGQVPTSPYRVSIGDLPLYDQHDVGIEVYNLRAEDLLKLGQGGAVGLLPLIAFTQGGQSLDTLEEAG